MQEYVLLLPFTTPLSLNAREHWAVKAKKTKAWRQAAHAACLAAKVPAMKKISVELHYAPRDARRRDPLNLVASLKAIEDGIVDAGVIPDDNPKYLAPVMPIIEQPSKSVRIWFVIRAI